MKFEHKRIKIIGFGVEGTPFDQSTDRDEDPRC